MTFIIVSLRAVVIELIAIGFIAAIQTQCSYTVNGEMVARTSTEECRTGRIS
jgi:hypothetical protein